MSTKRNRLAKSKGRKLNDTELKETVKQQTEQAAKKQQAGKRGLYHLPSKDLTGFNLREIAVAAAQWGVIINPDGTHQALTKVPNLEEMQKHVDGYIELVSIPPVHPSLPLGNITTMVVNEEGRLSNMPRNAIATYIAMRPIVGPAIWIKSEYVK